MVGYITESAGGNYTPTPEGQHIAVCARIIDLGTQPGSAKFPEPKRKIRIFWELPEERMTWQDQDGNEQEGPVLHSEQYTVSFHEKSTLRNHLEAWRGKQFTPEDFAGPPNGFHLSKLIGIPAVLQIVHDVKGDTTYANLNSIMRPMKDHFSQWKGRIEGATIFFDLDDFKREEWDKLSDRVREKIAGSPEYIKMFAEPEGQHDPSQGGGYGDPAPATVGDLEDEIPF